MNNYANFVLLFFSLVIFALNQNARALPTEGILGGFLAPFGNFTYHVTVKYKDAFCGGAIIGRLHVITAAHCLHDAAGNPKPNPIVVAGTVDGHSHPSTRIEVPVVKAYVPNQYPRRDVIPAPADIAVLKLKSRFHFNRGYFRPLTISPEIRDFSQKTTIITGSGIDLLRFKPYMDSKGQVVFDGYTSQKLRYAYALVLSDDLCRYFFRNLLSGQFCAQVFQSSVQAQLTPDGTCSGDSGSALVYEDKYLVGVLSIGPLDCNEVKASGIYTSVLPYIDFINYALKDWYMPEIMYYYEYN